MPPEVYVSGALLIAVLLATFDGWDGGELP